MPSPADASRRAWSLLAWLGILTYFLIAAWYTWQVSDPMPKADNWTNLDVFLRKAYYQGVGLEDFLWKRELQDHAQPLNKMLLWLNARYFGLDFALEGMFAMLLGLGAMLLLRLAALNEGEGDVRWSSLGILAIAAVFFSLNSAKTYSYSMVTMWFSLYLAMFASVVAAWKALNGRSPAWLLVATFAFGVIADDVGYLGTAAIVLALLLCGGRWIPWRRVLTVAAWCVAGLLLSRLFYAAFQGEIGALIQPRGSMADFAGYVESNGRDAWRWWAIPSAASFAHTGTMKLLVGKDAAPLVANFLGAVMLPMHAWFWWKAWKRKPDLCGFAAICIMLFYYAHVAGILFGRASVFGTDYMQAPRYVSFYQLGLVALLLMFVAAARDAIAQQGRAPWYLAAPAVLLVLFQVPVAWIALTRTESLLKFEEKKANILAAVGADAPGARAKCMGFAELRTVCAVEARRQRLIGLLVDNQLSIFAPQFPARHPRLGAAVARGAAGDPWRRSPPMPDSEATRRHW